MGIIEHCFQIQESVLEVLENVLKRQDEILEKIQGKEEMWGRKELIEYLGSREMAEWCLRQPDFPCSKFGCKEKQMTTKKLAIEFIEKKCREGATEIKDIKPVLIEKGRNSALYQ